MNRFIGSLKSLTTRSYYYFQITVTITHNQLTLSRYKTALSEVSDTTEFRSGQFTADGQSVVLVLSPIWGSWPDIIM
jgi:uncharacterized protein YhdP